MGPDVGLGLTADRVSCANGGRREKLVASFQGLPRTAWQAQAFEGRRETCAAACRTLTNHLRVQVVAVHNAEVEGGTAPARDYCPARAA